MTAPDERPGEIWVFFGLPAAHGFSYVFSSLTEGSADDMRAFALTYHPTKGGAPPRYSAVERFVRAEDHVQLMRERNAFETRLSSFQAEAEMAKQALASDLDPDQMRAVLQRIADGFDRDCQLVREGLGGGG